MKSLNPALPYGEVHGAPGIAFIQNGCLFNQEGQEIQTTPTPMLHNPPLAQQELTRRAALSAERSLSELPCHEVRRIARDQYGLNPGHRQKGSMIRMIVDRIMEDA